METSAYWASHAPKEINASVAYALGCTGSGIIVGVVDVPSDSDHPDLDANYVTGWDASAGNTSGDCGGIYSSSHGVHVAGIIAAENNWTGMHEIAHNAKIKPVTIFGDSEADDTNTNQLITAIGHASGSGIAVMNNSWGASEVASYSFGGGARYYSRPVLFSGAQLSSGELNARKTAASTTVVVWANGNDGQNNANGKMHSWTSNAGASSGRTSHADYIGYVDASANTNQNVPSWRGSYQFYDNGASGPWLKVVALNEADAITS
ncbi:S8 family serine peptidase [Candidatus Puniceispirillum sp.]|nr:S8 family serine peptidase [Candidatus Puniceispirillum sp.]